MPKRTCGKYRRLSEQFWRNIFEKDIAFCNQFLPNITNVQLHDAFRRRMKYKDLTRCRTDTLATQVFTCLLLRYSFRLMFAFQTHSQPSDKLLSCYFPSVTLNV